MQIKRKKKNKWFQPKRYWLSIGMSDDRAKLKSRGYDYCHICQQETEICKSFAGKYVICSQKCRNELDDRAKLQRKKTRYSKFFPDYDAATGNSRKCAYCDNTISHEQSLRTTTNICSEKCLAEHKKSFKKGITPIMPEYWTKQGYSLEDAQKQVNAEQRRRSILCVEHWIDKGYSEENAVKMVASIQSNNSKKGIEKSTHEERSARVPSSREYWRKKGLTEEEIDDKHHLLFSHSLECYIAREGIEEGTKNFDIFYEINRNAQTLDHYIEINGEEIGTQNWYRKFEMQTHSGISKELFNAIVDRLPQEFKNRHKIYFKGYNNSTKEFGKHIEGKYYFYDFVISSLRYCIEFNGDMFHANPKQYNADDIIPVVNKPAKDLWELDKRKKEFLINDCHYIVDVIWEEKYNRHTSEIAKNNIVEHFVNKILDLDTMNLIGLS